MTPTHWQDTEVTVPIAAIVHTDRIAPIGRARRIIPIIRHPRQLAVHQRLRFLRPIIRWGRARYH